MQINDNFGNQVNQLKATFDPATGPLGREAFGLAHDKNDAKKAVAEPSPDQVLNQQILETNLNVSFGSGNDSLTLLLKTAIEAINGVIEPELGISIEESVKSGVDVSPEATAERIVSLSTAFFSAYQDQHPEQDLETSVNNFVKIISGGIEQGFAEAREILQGLSVLEGSIATNIDTTYNLVQNNLQAFVDDVLGA